MLYKGNLNVKCYQHIYYICVTLATDNFGSKRET